MAVIGRLIGRAIAKHSTKNVLSSAQKRALKKATKASAIARSKAAKAGTTAALTAAQKEALEAAVKASALARSKGLGATIANRAARFKSTRKASIVVTNKLNLKRYDKGFKAGGITRVSTENFKGAGGRALKRSTYKARLASSRARYKVIGGETSIKNKVGQKAIGALVTGNLWRRRYSDLTTGENVRRNFTRGLKVAAVGTAAYYSPQIATAGIVTGAAAADAAKRSFLKDTVDNG